MIPIRVQVNGRWLEADVSPRTHLADFLREQLNLTGTHIGCEHGICGACTVEIDGEIARSCITYAVAVDGAEIRTVEGFDDDPLMARLRQAFTESHALQCGYCTPGMLIAARDLIARKSGLDTPEIRTEMSGNLCRCTGYMGIVSAIAAVMAETPEAAVEGRRPACLGPAPGPDAPDARDLSGRPEVGGGTAGALGAEDAAAAAEHGAPEFADEEAFTTLSDSFLVQHPRDEVWAHMADIERVARAMPGVTLDGPVEGDRLTGRIAVKLGPISAAFAGQGRVERREADYAGLIEGSGRDRDSASRARGRVAYELSETEEGYTRVDVTLAYALAGPLAQFGRAGLVKDVVARLASAFAENLERQISAPDSEPEEAAELKAGSLLFAVLVARVKAFVRWLFSRR